MARQSKQTYSGPSATRFISYSPFNPIATIAYPRQQSEQKKDARKKKTAQQDKPSPKKSSEANVWPCKINGCNKQFAREADLKRHQRTTKLHSVPGFACPQCDARFTRTDALRRHQKSRHNGVVIEPADGVERRLIGEDDPHSSSSRSKSRSRTPSSKENPAATSLPCTTVGPQSYYRQHTFPGGMALDSHYSPAVGLPTSATRLHQASWQTPPPWGGEGSQPLPHHMIHPGYANPYYNPPPQYYRTDTMMHSSDVVAHQQIPNSFSPSSSGEPSSSPKGSPELVVDPSLDHVGLEDSSEPGDGEATVIDPSLVSPPASHAEHGESCTNGQVPRFRETGSPPGRGHHLSSPGSGEVNDDGSGTSSEAAIVQHLLSPDRDPYPSPHSASLDRPLEMEQILTEDGEPMLNPAELLTQVSASDATPAILDLMLQILKQESLASPPPS